MREWPECVNLAVAHINHIREVGVLSSILGLENGYTKSGLQVVVVL
jgi:hypothetical protein